MLSLNGQVSVIKSAVNNSIEGRSIQCLSIELRPGYQAGTLVKVLGWLVKK
jgi:hypothetical protein